MHANITERQFLNPNRLSKVINEEQHLSEPNWKPATLFALLNTPDTTHKLERDDITYYTTLGYPDDPGFRSGTCY